MSLAFAMAAATWMVLNSPGANPRGNTEEGLRQETAEIRITHKNPFSVSPTSDTSSGRQDSNHAVISDLQMPSALSNPLDKGANVEGRENIGSSRSEAGPQSIGPNESFEDTAVLSSEAGEELDYFDSIEPGSDASFESTAVFMPGPGDGFQDIESFGTGTDDSFQAYDVVGPGPGENSLDQ